MRMTRSAISAIVLLAAASAAQATQETFTTAGPLNCTAVSVCVQNTTDNLFTISFVPAFATSEPSTSGVTVS